MPNANLDPYDCDCGWLEEAANDPSIPIGFDPEVNEFYVKHIGNVDGRVLIQFCPRCGGDAPVSHRTHLFEVVTGEEMIRLQSLFAPLQTRTDVVRAWGTPDEEIHSGSAQTEPAQNGVPGRTVFFDVRRYNSVSPMAVVDVLLGAGDRVIFSYSPKRKPNAG